MGVAYSYEAPIISARSAVVVIESDECCTMEPCTGRHWDRSLEKPDFVDMSQAEWSSFVSTMHHHVRSYKAEGWAMCILLLIPIGMILNGLVRECDEETGRCEAVLPFGSMGFFLLSIVLFILGSTSFRKVNMAIDSRIEELCSHHTSPSASFTYVTRWTGVCKPKHARTYRALVISPNTRASGRRAVAPIPFGSPQGGSSAPIATGVAIAMPPAMTRVRVVCPAGKRQGDSISVTAPSGTEFTVVVPDGVQAGQPFDVDVPAAPPLVVTGTVVPAGTPAPGVVAVADPVPPV
tara:strand:+ start:77 stop:955 length:879 start_codon:yes stop_codon:yes gene_type:complete